MTRRGGLSFICLSLGLAAVAAGVSPALAMDDPQIAKPLPRRPVWPFALGPYYGDGAPDWASNPRALRLDVGTFDTRFAVLEVPAELKTTAEKAAKATSPWIVQLSGPVTEAMKDALRARGVKLYTYYPQNAFVVRVQSPALLKDMPGVLWAAPFHPAYRIEPLLGQAPTIDPVKASNVTIDVRARLFEPSERGAAIVALEKIGASIDRETTFDPHGWGDAVYFTGTPAQILAAARLDEVRWVEEASREGIVMNAESKLVMQSGFVSRGTPMWDGGVDGSTQVVGDMDNGLDLDTILLANTASDPGVAGPAHRKVISYQAFGGGDLLSCGNYTHGTNTADCAAGNRVDLGQPDNLDGVAHRAKIVFQDIGVGTQIPCVVGSLSPPATLTAMYDQVRNLGGHLTNGSFSLCSGYGSHASDADQYMWDHKDFLPFFSAGNGGNGLVCPGTGKNVMAMGGYYQDPFFNFYGSTGPAPDGRMGPTVMAPACDNAGGNPSPYDFNTSTSIQSSDTNQTAPVESIVSQGACGTSFASPYGMGAGALVRDYFQKGYYPSGSANAPDGFAPTGALVRAVLMNSGELMTCCGSFMESTTTYGQGMGRVNLSRTLRIAGDTRTAVALRVVDKGAAAGLATGGIFEQTVDVSDVTVPLRATLVWVDRVGSALVNNLRLTVIGPGGGPSRTYDGRNFVGEFTRSEGAGGTANDSVNPFESVFVAPAELVAGTWTIRATGTNVPSGDPNFGNTQPFALVISGGFAATVKEVSSPSAAQPLVVTASSGTDVSWLWESVGGSGVVYDLYAGTIAAIRGGTYDHAKIDAAHCGLAAPSAVVSDRLDGIDRYYLVGMRNGAQVGSLGNASSGTPRPAGSPACP